MSFPSLFRERASPETGIRESLERSGPVIRPPLWLGLGLTVLAILGIAIWALSTRVDESVQTSGAVSYSPLPVAVQAPTAGSIVAAAIPVGSFVSQGQPLMIVAGQGRETPVRAPISGSVVGSSVTVGATVQAGDTVAQIARAGSVLRAYLYVKLGDGEALRRGQRVLVTPSGPQQQQESLLEGHITDVDDVPATPGELERVLGPTLGPRAANGPPLIQVIALLERGSRRAATPLVREPEVSTPGLVVPLRPQTPLSGRIVVSGASLFNLTL